MDRTYAHSCMYILHHVSALLGISISKAVVIVLLQTGVGQGLYLGLETGRMLALNYLGVIT